MVFDYTQACAIDFFGQLRFTSHNGGITPQRPNKTAESGDICPMGPLLCKVYRGGNRYL
jgi:hypothetical protein